jgi:S1-C subfamily serine protease
MATGCQRHLHRPVVAVAVSRRRVLRTRPRTCRTQTLHLPDTIDAIRPSVVQIRATGSEGTPQGRTLGTGFLVTSQFVVTAKHVVDAVDESAGEALHVAFAGPEVDTPELKMRAGFIGTGGHVLAVGADHDLALIRAADTPELMAGLTWANDVAQPAPRPVRLSDGKLREGTAIAVSGYPLDEPSLVTNAGILASSFSLVQATSGFQERHLGDFTANPGNSGGPVYEVADGTIVGVCVAGKLTPIVGGVGAHAAGLTVIVPVAELAAFLAGQGVSIEDRSRSAPGPDAGRRGKKRRKH